MNNSQICPQACLLRNPNCHLSELETLGIRAHDSNTIQSQLEVDKGLRISVFAEKDSNDHWLFSFWQSSDSCAKQCGVEKEFIQSLLGEYCLLFSACVEKLSRSLNDPELIRKIRIISYDDWIKDNFLKEWSNQSGSID